MADTGVTVEGLDQLAEYFRNIGEFDPKDALTEFGKVTATEAVRIAPKRTGAMAAAISSVYYGGAGGVAIKVDTTKAPHGYTFHATAMGKARGYMTFKVPAHTRRGSQVSAYGRVAKIRDYPFLHLAYAAKEQEATDLLEEALNKVVNP